MVAAVLIPLAIRAILRGGEFIEAQTWNALAANSFAVMLSMWFRVSIDQYPGNRASYLLFPSIVAGHAFNAVASSSPASATTAWCCCSASSATSSSPTRC